jgi:hypothetical protein
MERSNEMGRNRTGIDMSPKHSKAMVRAAEELTPRGAPDGQMLEKAHREYIEEADAVGSVPMPGTIKGALKSAMDKLAGRNPETLINKLGERLAFERSGVRLYEGVLAKCEAKDDGTHVPLDRLRRFRDEEARHFALVKQAMESLGADPTAQTPDADVTALASMGVQKVVADPRTTVSQCLEALLTAELTDNAGWELLVKLTEEMGLDDISTRFRGALQEEEVHLREVREWVERGVLAQT